MSTYTEILLSAIAEAELTSADVKRPTYIEAIELIADAVLTVLDAKTNVEDLVLTTQSVLMLLDDVNGGIYCLSYTDEITGLPVEVCSQKPQRQGWSLSIEVEKAGPYGAVDGDTIPFEEILSADLSYRTSDTGSAQLVLHNDKSWLAGSRLRIKLTEETWGVEKVVFTGFTDNESSIAYDYMMNTTSLELKDSLSWLADNRRKITRRVRGSSNAALAGLIASDVGEDWYALWTGSMPDEVAPGETRQAVIENVLAQVGFPYGAIFPNDGGVIGWDVEITEEAPLDVVRHIAESAKWLFFSREDGTLEFRGFDSPEQEMTISNSEYDAEPGLVVDWGGVYMNKLQVRGVPKKYAALQYVYKDDVAQFSIAITSLVGDPWEIGGVKQNLSTTFPTLYRNVDITNIRNQDGNKVFIKGINAIPEEDQIGVLAEEAADFDAALSYRQILLDKHLGELLYTKSYPVVYGLVRGVSSLTEFTATYILGTTYYVYCLWIPDVASVRGAYTRVPLYVLTEFHQATEVYTLDSSTNEVTTPDYSRGTLTAHLSGEILESVEIEDQASVVVSWNQMVAAFGEYDGQIYENPFISSTAECEDIGHALIRAAHKLGMIRLTCPFLSKLFTRGLGSLVNVKKPDGGFTQGMLDEFSLRLDTQTGRLDMQAGIKTDSLEGSPASVLLTNDINSFEKLADLGCGA